MIIRGAKIFDSERKEFLDGQEIWIEEGIIAQVGRGFDKPGRDVIDLSGMLVLPGWIDAHLHLTLSGNADPLHEWQKNGAVYTAIQSSVLHLWNHLRAGVTMVRDMGGDGDVVLAIKKAQKDGIIGGPEILTAGKALTMTGGHIHQISREVDGVDEARKGAREELKKGVDLLKVIATGGILTEGTEPGAVQLNENEIRAIVEEAHKAGRKVAAHAESFDGIENSLIAGVDTIEHGIDLGLHSIQMMKDQGVILVPTLVAPRLIVRNSQKLSEEMVAKAEAVVEEHKHSFALAYSNACRIAVGTDAGTPFNHHGAYHQEIAELLQDGMKVEDVLQAASLNGAVALGVEKRYGNIGAEKVANLTVIEDRLNEKDWYRRVKMTMVNGRIFAING